jgi:hypothetical protein
LSPADVNPRFYRTHFLIVLGLTVAATVSLRETATTLSWIALGLSLFLAGCGSLAWSLERAPGGSTLIVLTVGSLTAALGISSASVAESGATYRFLPNELSSAVLLGAATSAMLLGHSYLIAPGMSLRPLFRLLGAILAALGMRAVLCGAGLRLWTTEHSLVTLDDVTLLLPLRWGLGLLLPAILGAMAWQTAKIRSTQSATGILYVVVIFTFLGELISQLLFRMTDVTL